jgi:D-alanyl-D-alanine dipeptidase
MTLLSFEHIPIQECGESLVNLADYPFELEPVYYRQGLSKDSQMYARESVVEKLIRIQQKLKDFRFKIWDAWRSRDVQNNIYQKFWNELKNFNPDWSDEKLAIEVGKFVTAATNPQRIPPHATGGAIDLTLVDSSGQELEMGTEFDSFSPESASLYYEDGAKNSVIRANRRLLREAMSEEGFRFDADEWWHYDFGNQLWAAALGKPFAIYGEKTSP